MARLQVSALLPQALDSNLTSLSGETMKPGDIVTFMDEGSRYARWFFGKMGVVQSLSDAGLHCSVKWLTPVRYHNRDATVSSFQTSSFEVMSE